MRVAVGVPHAHETNREVSPRWRRPDSTAVGAPARSFPPEVVRQTLPPLEPLVEGEVLGQGAERFDLPPRYRSSEYGRGAAAEAFVPAGRAARALASYHANVAPGYRYGTTQGGRVDYYA